MAANYLACAAFADERPLALRLHQACAAATFDGQASCFDRIDRADLRLLYDCSKNSS
jgi:hypothetical protein